LIQYAPHRGAQFFSKVQTYLFSAFFSFSHNSNSPAQRVSTYLQHLFSRITHFSLWCRSKQRLPCSKARNTRYLHFNQLENYCRSRKGKKYFGNGFAYVMYNCGWRRSSLLRRQFKSQWNHSVRFSRIAPSPGNFCYNITVLREEIFTPKKNISSTYVNSWSELQIHVSQKCSLVDLIFYGIAFCFLRVRNWIFIYEFWLACYFQINSFCSACASATILLVCRKVWPVSLPELKISITEKLSQNCYATRTYPKVFIPCLSWRRFIARRKLKALIRGHTTQRFNSNIS
jgi:hypothetical protein